MEFKGTNFHTPTIELYLISLTFLWIRCIADKLSNSHAFENVRVNWWGGPKKWIVNKYEIIK